MNQPSSAISSFNVALRQCELAVLPMAHATPEPGAYAPYGLHRRRLSLATSYPDRLALLHQRMLSLATSYPDRLALLHKEHGQWCGYAWKDVAQEVTQLVVGLRSRGLDGNSCLAVCGPFEPLQLLLVLAAGQLGARVLSVPTGLGAEALQAWLSNQVSPVRHAYVHARRDITAWSVNPALEADTGHLFTRRSSVVTAGRWRSEPVAALYKQPRRDSRCRISLRASLRTVEIGWAQEGSDWTGGLDVLISRWVDEGFVLALPETLGTVAHDRIEIQPSQLILSLAACEQFRAELQSRLPQGAHWASRLVHRVVANVLRGASRGGFVQWKVAQLLGLSRLNSPMVPVTPSAAAGLVGLEAGHALFASATT